MQTRFSTPSSLAAHHRRLMASCAESGCPHVRQRSGAKSSARTVGESLCISKSVEAHDKGPIVSARNLPTGCQQQCSLVVPTVRPPRHLTEPSAKSPQKQPTKRPEREGHSSDQPHSAGTCTTTAAELGAVPVHLREALVQQALSIGLIYRSAGHASESGGTVTRPTAR